MTLLSRSLHFINSFKTMEKADSVQPHHPVQEFKKLYETSRTLSDSTDSLLHFVKNTIENMETVSLSIHEIVNAAELQSEETEKSLVNSETLGEVLNTAVDQIQHMETAAGQSLRAAETGKITVDVLAQQSIHNKEISNKLHATMKDLEYKTEAISKAMESIFQVSQSIQMLSLNASIEAAHAGEQGKGFAVVAQEVRKLAVESAVSGRTITELLQGMQQQVRTFSRTVDETRKSSENVSQAVEETKQQFDLIHLNLSTITEHSAEASHLLHTASDRKDQLIQHLHTVASLAQQSLASAYEVARLSEKQASSVLTVAGSTQDLQGISQDIKSSVVEIIGDAALETKQTTQQIRIGFIPNLTHAPALLAIHHELFKQQFDGQFETRAFSAGPAVVDALLNNQIDIGYTGPGPVFEAFSKKQNIQIISGVNQGGAALLVRADSSLQQVGQLRGKTIAIPQYGNGQHILLRQLLGRHGLKDVFRGGDIRIIQAKPSTLISMFANNQIDAALVQEPWVTLLENKAAARVLVDWQELYNEGLYPNTVIAVNRDFVQNHPEAVSRFLQAHNISLQSISEKRPDTYHTLSQSLEQLTGQSLSADAIERALKRIIWNSKTDHSTLQGFAQLIKQEGFLNKDIDFELLLVK
ncbi:ABC transporter, substrate-binding protein, aliphatic sulfonates family [Paenibacillus sp. 1_12]|uniref:aliphatic sulfonate ABC transporter substrate-binding protein n=1 Tax=Paenibacillus sp. 1_12 TaxID=1566278 RepID=UPI0008E27E55|nr:aliphatic sulfonate ABC transporter substrate-binding protein [Paenibacillus sp. 1_12]SFL65089.1 ABC transporter, substrate-binding protein, aliphatic sulfonates family [Paenibacillus sp. 1_12]